MPLFRSHALVVALVFAPLGCTTDESPAGPEEGSTSSSASSDGGSSGGTTSSTSSSGETTTAVDGDSSRGETSAECVPAEGDAVGEDVMLEAADGTQLAATYARPANGTCLPAVVLIHQFTLNRGQWDAVTDDFVAAGYATLALDLRGHGDSDAQQGALSDLLNDPDQAPQDVSAAVTWLASAAEVDGARVGAVGTSIGANLTVVALHAGEVVAAVPVSPRLEAVEALAGMPDALSVSNIFCLASDGDGGGAQASTCTDLVASATGQGDIEIIRGSSAHGVTIVDDFPEVVPAIIAWLDAVL